MNAMNILFFALVFLVVQQGINAIRCYTCGVGADGCGPSFKSTGNGVIPGTNSTATYCTKSVYASNTNAIARGYAGTCTEQNYAQFDTTYYTYCCQTDLCNKGPIGKANLIFAWIIASIGFLLIK